MTKLYVLKLQNNKYYVGTTDRIVQKRFDEHVNGEGSEWTRLHKPIEVIEEIQNPDSYDEDKITKKYMDKYGINNVRGGSYTEVVLPDYQIKSLEKELCTSHNKCYKCLKTGHFANDCNAKTDVSGNIIEYVIWYCDFCNNEFDNESDALKHEMLCNKNKYNNQNKNEKCYKCGRFGHWIKDCYATTHVNGNEIYDSNDDSDDYY